MNQMECNIHTPINCHNTAFIAFRKNSFFPIFDFYYVLQHIDFSTDGEKKRQRSFTKWKMQNLCNIHTQKTL